MIKRIFLSASILFFLFTACHKEQALPPIVEKSYNYENQLKRKQIFDFQEADLTCIGSHYDIFDGDTEFNIVPVDPTVCYKERPTELYYVLIENNGSNFTFTLNFYQDVHDAIIEGEVKYMSTFSFTEVSSGAGETSTNNWLNLTPSVFQEYEINCHVTFTDFDCVYEKNSQFIIQIGFSQVGGSGPPLFITPIDNTSFVGHPLPPGECDSGLNAVAVIVP